MMTIDLGDIFSDLVLQVAFSSDLFLTVPFLGYQVLLQIQSDVIQEHLLIL